MKIIIVNDYAYISGGAGQVALLNAVEMAKAGFDVVLFTAVGPVSPDLYGVPNLTVVCLGQLDILTNPGRIQAAGTGIWNLKAAQEMQRLLSQLDPRDTIVHIHSFSKALSSSIIAQAHRMGFKIVFHMHDYAVACPNMGLYCFPTRSICCEKPMTMACIVKNCDRRSYWHKMWRLARQVIQRYLGYFPGGIDRFVAVSDFSHAILKPLLPHNAQVDIIKNPISVVKTPRIEAEANRYFLFIGRLDHEKNAQLLALAARQLALPVMFIGEGPCREEVKELYPASIMTGWLPNHEVQKEMAKARAVVLPSSWYETQGLIVSEAAARGVPAIVSDTCAAVDFVRDGVTGLVFKNNDKTDLVAKIIQMQDDRLAATMSQSVYNEYWERPSSVNEYIQNILSVYIEVLDVK